MTSVPDEGGRASAPGDAWLVRLCGILVVAGALVRVLIALSTTTYIPPDGLQYLNIARSLLDGAWGSLPTIPHYLYGVAIAAASLGVVDLAWAGRVVSLVSGLALIGVLGLLAGRVAGREAGWATAALTAVFPPLADASAVVLSESLFLFAACSGLLLALRSLDGRARLDGGLAGVALGLAYLTRPEGFGVAVGCIALLLAFGVAGRSGWWARPAAGHPLAGAAAAAVGFGLLLVPYVAYVHAVHGSWVLSGYQLNSDARALTGALGADAARSLAVGTDILYSAFDANPWIRAVKVLRRAYLQGIPWLLPPLVLILVGAGVARACEARPLYRWIFLAPFLLIAPVFAALTLPLVVPRYYLLTAALLLPVAGAGIVHVGRARAWVGPAALVVVALSMAPDLWRIPATAARPSRELVAALRTLSDGGGGPLATNSLPLLHLTGMDEDPVLQGRLRDTAPDSLVLGAAARGSYVAIQLRHDPTYDAGWDAVAGAGRAPRGMEVVGRYSAVGGPIVLYRVEGGP
ncbi:MAG TPA: glycosyltransferase family 39 protein [Longimicrobiales bacterium]|nr:glycosyltransferase family 39 protein [Longimicrobiales bacterium]